nr:serine protease easter-like [Aedes albopictus]
MTTRRSGASRLNKLEQRCVITACGFGHKTGCFGSGIVVGSVPDVRRACSFKIQLLKRPRPKTTEDDGEDRENAGVKRTWSSQSEVVDMSASVVLVPVTLRIFLVESMLILILMLIGVDARVLKEDLWDSNGCDIPGQTKKGFCTEAGNCAAYQKLLNDSGDNSIEREDFIQQLQCGKFDGDRVCCPDSDNYQIGVYEDAVMCGQAAYSYRIRGGMIADIDEFPWTAMLLRMHRKSQSLYYHCGGVLIGKRFVLTAAHCIVPKVGDSKQDPLKYVRLREYDVFQDPDCMMSSGFMDCSEEKLDMKPRKLIAHPGFTAGSAGRNHDIGLIQIDPIPLYSDFLLPICLPEVGLDQGDRRGRKLNIAGWGKNGFFCRSRSDKLEPDKDESGPTIRGLGSVS